MPNDNSTQEITLVFKPTSQDYMKVTWAITMLKTGQLFIVPICLAVVGISLYGVNCCFGLRNGSGDFMAGLPYIIAIAIAPLVLMVLLNLFGFIAAWRRSSTNEMMLLENNYSFGEDQVLAKDIHLERRMAWTYFSEAIEIEDYYLLIPAINPNVGYFTPKRAFESSEQEAAFRELIGRKLKFKAKGG
jgi:YcxB-like protein